MAAGEEGRFDGAAEDADMAKAFQALAQGEQTATQLENHLTKLEARIEELMKQASENQELAQSAAAEGAPGQGRDATTSATDSTKNRDSSQ
ncbi:Hypothetical protein D9617_5g069550 [Elsinoe fawcettii]|nr:Hypothetical protein D9617_5g069550 [Elsinoe fawcettii]